MTKNISIVFVIFFPFMGRAQSGLIDSLKTVLLTKSDTQRINCLNAISKASLYIQGDTSHSYGAKAFHESSLIQYKQGMADALLNEGKLNNARNTPAEAEKALLQAITLYTECHNIDMTGSAYLNLGISLSNQFRFTEAISAYLKADEFFRIVRDSTRSGYILTLQGLAYKANGNYEKAFDCWIRALEVRKRNQDHIGVLFSLSNMGILFAEVEDYHAAIDYYLQTVNYAKNYAQAWSPFLDKLADAYASLDQYDSALYYIRECLLCHHISMVDSTLEKPTSAETDILIAHMFLIQKEYKRALDKLFQWKTNRGRMEVLDYTGAAYLGLKNYKRSIDYARELLQVANRSSSRAYVRDATALLWKAYDQQKKYDSAYRYYSLYAAMKDSVSNYRFIRQMAMVMETAANEQKELAHKKETTEKEFLYKQKLEKESSIRKLLIGGISALLLISFIIVTNISLRRKNEKLERERLQNSLNVQQLESEKKQAELQHQAKELEMQALRSQMNPHFIFNSLNSINRFILQNNKTRASEYLTKFSKLVRLILQNSQASLISLESELESLRLYLDLEALRFDYRFGYKISLTPALDVSMLKIPPLIIQPYVENAIWHGLMHKEEKGQLDIEISQEKDHLYIKIADDGVGRHQSAAFGSKTATLHKSMGLRITANRIAALERSDSKESSVTINDMTNPDGTAAGTEVTIKIPVLYD